MELQDQWLFEAPASLANPNQEWLWEQDFAEDPPNQGKENRGIFAKWVDTIGPYVMPVMMGVAGIEAAQQPTSFPKEGTTVVSPPPEPKQFPKPKVPEAGKALKAASEAERKRREAQEKQRGKTRKPGKTGGNPPTSIRIRRPLFTGYPLPPVTAKMPTKNKAGFFVREAESNFVQEAGNQQHQWLFQAPVASKGRDRNRHYSTVKYERDLLKTPSRSNAEAMAASSNDSPQVEITKAAKSFTSQAARLQAEIIKLAKTDQGCAGCDYERLVRAQLKLKPGEKIIGAGHPDSLYKGMPVEITLAEKMNGRKMEQIARYLAVFGKVLIVTPNLSRRLLSTLNSVSRRAQILIRANKRRAKFDKLRIRILTTQEGTLRNTGSYQ